MRERVEIVTATIRDLSYICANLCDEDRIELECQWPADIDPAAFSGLHMAGSQWCATLDGQPVQAFGVIPSTPAGNVLIAWAFGTRSRRRAIPAVTRFMLGLVPGWIECGVTRVEARAIVGHLTAGRWLRVLGASEVPLPCWGRNGEDFTLLSWTAVEWAQSLESCRHTSRSAADGQGEP